MVKFNLDRINPRVFWSHVDKTDTCWLWTARLSPCGGRFGTGGYGIYRGRVAHRIAYSLKVGPIPDGMTLDHLCEVTKCVNPSHLEPVTTGENTRRHRLKKTSCKYGHPFDAKNTKVRGGKRICLTCERRRGIESSRRRTAQRRAAA